MKKIFSLFLVILILLTAVVPSFAADETIVTIATTSVEDDLKAYDPDYLKKYLVDYADTDIHLITMQEDGYSADGKTSDYALYFYLYNPSQKLISVSDFNKIQLASKWENGEPVEYTKYSIELVDMSENKRFIKAKLSGSSYPTSAFCCINKDASRSYSVSGIELYGQDTGATMSGVKDYSVSYIYTFSGYSTNNTLVSRRSDLTTITLDVHQTSYLTGDSGKETNDYENGAYSNQVNSVYFSIPRKYEESLGELYSIDYEYYQYRTAPMFFTDNDEIYDKLLTFQAKNLRDGDYGYRIFDLVRVYGLCYWYGSFWGDKYKFHILHDPYYDEYPELGTYQEFFTALLEVKDISDRDNFFVSSDELEEYFKSGYAPLSDNLSSVVNHSGVSVGSSRYNGDLFDLDYFDENYIRRERTVDDSFSLPSLADILPSDSSFNSFWYKFNKYGWDVAFRTDKYDNSLDDVKYIEKVNYSDIPRTQRDASNEFLISYNDVTAFREYVYDSTRQDKSVYLLRYAASDDYYNLMLSCTFSAEEFYDILMVQQTVYLDFDVIDLSFRDSNNKVTVIPVVSNPTDNFTGIENVIPDEPNVMEDLFLLATGQLENYTDTNWFAIVCGILIAGIGIYLLVNFGYIIFPAIGNALSAAFAYAKSAWANIAYSSKQRRRKRRVKRNNHKRSVRKKNYYSNSQNRYGRTSSYSSYSNKKNRSSYGRKSYKRKKK